jgi:hypothetical protein
MGVGGQHQAPATLPMKITPYPIQETSLVLGLAGHVEKISSLPGFDPWTIQPVMSCYPNYAIPTLEGKGKHLQLIKF